MTVKEYLQAYGEKQKDLDFLCDRIEALEEQIHSISGCHITDIPKSPSPELDRIGHKVSVVLDLKKELEEMQQALSVDYKEVNALVDKLKNTQQRNVVKSRYIDLFSWNDINNLVFGAKSDFIDKEESYMRRVFMLHKSALSELEKIYN